ncbi:MAG: hypothetical protein KA419_01195 [Acidobacteria bacterium]|nr:hypothetical protein [Acidobacteriota bacterium]
MLEHLTRDSFTPHLNTRFEIRSRDGGAVEVELVEVTGMQTAACEAFSLLFRGPLAPVLTQDTHRVRHAALGEFDLFVGPIHSGWTDAVCYQAVFNRLRP